MGIDPLETMTADVRGTEVAPKMLRRPADAPSPFPHIRASEHLRALHEGWAGLYGQAGDVAPALSAWQRVKSRVRRVLPLGGGDRELIGILIRTVDAIAQRCDEMAERLSAQESLSEDVTDAFGSDIATLRADVIRLRSALARMEQSPQ